MAKKQDKKFIKVRDSVRKYVRMKQMIGGPRSTYAKMIGQEYNGVKNVDLSEMDVDRVLRGIDKVSALLDDLRKELLE